MPAVAEYGELRIELLDAGRVVTHWTRYQANSHFLTPTDGFTFVLGDEAIDPSLFALLTPGARVRMSAGDHVQAVGQIDRVQIQSDRGTGTMVTIDGRDVLAPAVDSGIDPRQKFAAGQTFEQIIEAVFTPFGFTSFDVDNDANRNVLTGQKRSAPVSKKGKPLKNFQAHQLKPYPNEGAYEFAERLAKRFGLHIWPRADGSGLVVGKPDFEQPGPLPVLRHKRGKFESNLNNVKQVNCIKDWTEQPSVIIATGRGGDPTFGRCALKAALVNEYVAYDEESRLKPEVAAVLAAHPDARIVVPVLHSTYRQRFISTVARPVYLHDDESKTHDELEFYVRREMAQRQRRVLTYSCTVAGHAQQVGNTLSPWAVDTLVDVDDDFADIHESLWVLSRTFRKDRAAGTTTELELIRPWTLFFG